MIRRATLLPLLTITLLLGACGKPPAPAVSVAPRAPTDPTAPAAVAAPGRTIDVWQAVGPLMAGNYTGSCMLPPATTQQDGAIRLGADGKAAAGALQVDFGMAKLALLKRTRDNAGRYATMASVAVDADNNAGGMFLLQANSAATQANFTHGAQMMLCTGVSGAASLNARPLYPTLLQLVRRKKQSIGCADMKNALVRKDADVVLAAGTIRIGPVSFDMNDAVSEMLTLSDGGAKLMFSVELPHQRSAILLYDGAGKLLAASNANDEKVNQACFVQGAA
jgi:hypothetical protein